MCPHISHRRGNAALSEILDKVDKKRRCFSDADVFQYGETSSIATAVLGIAFHFLITGALLLTYRATNSIQNLNRSKL